MEKVTLDDVARVSGVSRSAASRALNDRPGVRSDVRERVHRIADDLGFRPNRAARNLASGRSSVIGLIIPSTDLRVDPYGAAMTHAVGRAAAHQDLGLMLHLAAEEPGQTVHHILRDGLIDGLLISTVAVGSPLRANADVHRALNLDDLERTEAAVVGQLQRRSIVGRELG